MMQGKMISTNRNFHTSVNIAFDLPDDTKIKNFIATTSACSLVENLFMSTDPKATSRAKVLTGAYGRGKSHIVLMTLALLSRKDPELFTQFFKETRRRNPKFANYAEEYVGDNRRLLPVVITGNSSDLAQSFLFALFNALKIEGLEAQMPHTNVQAVLAMIRTWKIDYPDTYKRFTEMISLSPEEFTIAIKRYDGKAYDEFIELYPKLTSGGAFNSFLGLDVVSVYAATIENLKQFGYDGLCVVYDEFSKYLETNISEASLNDVKLLQDFAEKCNRSGSEQLHLLLICHKDISNYIDRKLPKDRVDGWRGVSGRFEHIEIRNGFAESYELIRSSILKSKPQWPMFLKNNRDAFDQIEERITATKLIDDSLVKLVVEGCYPLHPFSTFLLPRISERVAQNERTLFTYLTSNEKNSLSQTSLEAKDGSLKFVTPDSLYDYFEPLFRKEAYTSEIHALYELTSRILAILEGSELEKKIVKSLMLIYSVAQFECLAPTKNSIIDIYVSAGVSADEVTQAINHLIRQEAVVYLKQSNGYLRLKEFSGVDIEAEIERYIEINQTSLNGANVLNEIVSTKAVYPSRHNDENEIVRFFRCQYVNSDGYWNIERNGLHEITAADGYLIAIQPNSSEDLSAIKESVTHLSKSYSNVVFVVPRKCEVIENVAFRYKAACSLRDEIKEDALLADEYGVLIEDYLEVIASYNAGFFQPEINAASYYHVGTNKRIHRKAQLSELLSKICDSVFSETPIINNESINKNELSSAAIHSRTKILSGLCCTVLEPNLGLHGNGQECSIMRSVFSVTGIIENINTVPEVNLSPSDARIAHLFEVIRSYFYAADQAGSLEDLYQSLTGTEYKIGLKRGLVILFVTLALREDWNNLLLLRGSEEQRLTAGVLNDVDCHPEKYSIKPLEWTPAKADFVKGVKALFSDHAVSNSSQGEFIQAVDAMSRWYLALPRFTKTAQNTYESAFNKESYSALPKEFTGLMKALKKQDINPRGFLFEELPKLFSRKTIDRNLLSQLSETKSFIDNYVITTIEGISNELRAFFDASAHPDASLSSIVGDWCESLSDDLREHVFSGSTSKIIEALLTFTSDEEYSLKRLFKAVTSLRIEDWDERTIQLFLDKMKLMKSDIEDYEKDGNSSQGGIVISYVNKEGVAEARSFDPVPYSARAKLLKNEIENAIDEMGQAIDDSEKRQVLFEVLRGMC